MPSVLITSATDLRRAFGRLQAASRKCDLVRIDNEVQQEVAGWFLSDKAAEVLLRHVLTPALRATLPEPGSVRDHLPAVEMD